MNRSMTTAAVAAAMLFCACFSAGANQPTIGGATGTQFAAGSTVAFSQTTVRDPSTGLGQSGIGTSVIEVGNNTPIEVVVLCSFEVNIYGYIGSKSTALTAVVDQASAGATFIVPSKTYFTIQAASSTSAPLPTTTCSASAYPLTAGGPLTFSQATVRDPSTGLGQSGIGTSVLQATSSVPVAVLVICPESASIYGSIGQKSTGLTTVVDRGAAMATLVVPGKWYFSVQAVGSSSTPLAATSCTAFTYPL